MRVSRSEVSFRPSIQRDRRHTGAKAMSSSFPGREPGSAEARTKRSRDGPTFMPGSTGSHTVAGASASSSAIFRGPVRRSMSPAMEVRQLSAAICRCAPVISTRASFSASAKVATDTSGPAAEDVLKAGVAPGVVSPAAPAAASAESAEPGAPDFPPRQAATKPARPTGARIRNWRRVFMDHPRWRIG